ncbi:hypothetical protein PHYSODRAFT_322888 [Phytophthora sojae]|uniref:Uncharacterized protein n=1 Tax=Phytophthora sojae (strain P6497) TaxID=1094619 RepID=G4YHP4_PHYSP|nr:hypothetical protein PHYSODRAFT_322888 [Phytophthora sojae]EGZ29362.1 hypothetical protein PHYSODRAFT_322888 [Phytophthora sojae]|eukprot:XP_009516637.1 hypothetical protein PHYSODRAFT_322888 [Phytophthora sojae]
MKHPSTWRHTQPSEDGYASAEETVSEMIKRRKELQKAFAAGDVAKLMGARRRMEAHERGHTRGGPRGSLPRARTELQRIAAGDVEGMLRVMDDLLVTTQTLDPLSHKFLPHEANDLDEKLSKEVKVMKATVTSCPAG